jgi:GST-like protein
VIDKRLADHAYLAGGDYSIADVATWPWVSRFEWHALDHDNLDGFPHVKRWYREIASRPAVRQGYDVPARGQEIPRA